MAGIGIGMVGALGLISIACLKFSAKWKRAWQYLSLRVEKGGDGAGLIRVVTRSFADDVSALSVEVWGILMWYGNQESVYASSSE